MNSDWTDDRSTDQGSEQEHQQRLEKNGIEHRQTFKLILALVVVWIAIAGASRANGVDCGAPLIRHPLQLDGFTPASLADNFARNESTGRVAYVQLHAALANFDADADPDGWQATMVLRASDGLIVTGVGQATFQIFDAAGWNHSAWNHFGHDHRRSLAPPITRGRIGPSWTTALEFNQHGVAVNQLPATTKVRQTLGWGDATTIDRDTRMGSGHSLNRSTANRFAGDRWNHHSNRHRYRHFFTRDLSEVIDFPQRGWLWVQVRVAGQGNVSAIAPIDLRPAILVDTSRRYR